MKKYTSQLNVGVDIHCFEDIYNRYFERLVFFANKMIRDRLQAEDVVTEIFLKFWQRKQEFDMEQTIKSFLYISTRNACINYLEENRYRQKQKRNIERLTSGVAYNEYMNRKQRVETRNALHLLIESLPTNARQIIEMNFFLNLSHREIALALDLSIHTVRNQKARGISLMQERLLKTDLGT